MPLVLYASCDEGEEEKDETCLEEKGERSINLEWVKEIMGMSDEEPNEVVVLEEVKKKPEDKSKSSISTPAMKNVDDDDDDEDDCVVLDGDPENRVTSVDDSPTESDEVFVVAEKGQIACRDYPHPRHLCAKFPFSSTPNERHCDQCHCYVCDSLAPCLKWGNGLSSLDHCHATDKSEIWITMRKNFKLGMTAPVPASTNYGTLGNVRNAQHNHIMPLDIMLLSPNPMLLNQTSRSTVAHAYPVNLIPQNQASRPMIRHPCPSLDSSLQNQVSRTNTVPECSLSTNFRTPYGSNNGRCQVSGSTLVRNRYQSHSVPRQLLGVRNHAIQRARRHAASILGHQFLHSHHMNHSSQAVSGLSTHVNPAQQYDRLHAASGFPNNTICYYGQNDAWHPKSVFHPHPSSELNNLSSLSNYTAGYETQAYHQSNDNPNLYAYCVQGNGAPSNYVTGLSRNQVLNQQEMGSHAWKYCCQQKLCYESQIESAMKADCSAFDSRCVEYTSQSKSCLQSSGCMNTSPSLKETCTQFTGSTNLGSVDDVVQWLLDDENSVPDGDLASQMNIPSPDFSALDAGMLLSDFDNSWNYLAHV
ncbi:hypothetical protein RJT34_18919 [Clitoria ternatea]|uniref:Ig-like domain-containing protein n=1 Tax=Clitoria ternatea TaxID=43366 RepID=A0AAN9P2M8_CLITE